MKTKAAVLWGVGEDWSVEEIELADPTAGEVQVQLAASGLCHSDEHIRTGDNAIPTWPFIGGHEGAGIVTRVGEGVTSVKEGDHVVLAFVPSCGKCPMCVRGHSNLCDLGADLLTGKSIATGGPRQWVKGQGALPMCLLGTFSPYVTVHEASVVKIHDWIPLEKAALVGCGVTTGWGSAVYAADVQPGETVGIIGAGGVGSNAIQGAKIAGARHIIAIDPVEFKREQAKVFGATHAYESMEAAVEPIRELTWGRMLDKAVMTVGRLQGDWIGQMMDLVGKGGTGVLTAVGDTADFTATLNKGELTTLQKRLQGALFGAANPRFDIPRLLDLYLEGQLKLDELVTDTYRLEDINQAYDDLAEGKNIRGLILYSDADR